MTATPQAKTPRPADTDATVLLDRAVLRAQRVVLWERIWPALVTVGVAISLFLIASWAGLWLVLPPIGRIIGVLLFAALTVASLWPVLRLRRPTRAEALGRLDQASGLIHRPATAIGDTLATKPDDPIGAALWRAHLARTIAAARALRAGIPTPGLAARDPRAVRALALVALVAAFFLAPGSHWSRVRTAFDWRGAVTPQAYRLDAWIDPPAYTGRPPLVLPGLRSDDPTTTQAAAVSVPVGSVLVVRAAGIATDALKIEGGLEELKPAADAPPAQPDPRQGASERRFTVAKAGSVQFTGPDQHSVSWRIAAIADGKPSIAFAKDPQTGPRNALVLSYRVEDDYGVKEAQAIFAPTPPERGLFPRPGSPAPVLATPLVPPPDFALALPQTGAKGGAGQTTKDLVTHPWAGARVQVTLKARDEAGNEGVSETKTFRLPARAFSKPVARALIEERRRLALDPSTRTRVEAMLAGLTLAPDQFAIPSAEYLGLRTAYYRLRNARSDDDLRGVVDYLWDVAVLIEDGTLSAAERELRAAQEALREALQRGASDEEIKRLAKDLRQAMDKMMRQLAEEARRDGGTDARPLDQNTRVVRPQDLQRMVDRIENLARSGSRDAAKQLLDELQAMMDGMKPGNRQAGRQQGQQQQSELGAMIQEQQRLRDRTYREGRPGQQGQQGQRGQRGQQGQQGQQGQG
ncbi:TIGR02302 family protein, partial [Azorhizobium sp. AG788]|uniref:TIGR02302 family protein n=1 Tax=Azorhizobium sp. AG788 TaxID=2183897 RepID=UPI003138F077